MKEHDILVIIVNYNGKLDTIECIESLKKSTKPADILVVDNHSVERPVFDQDNDWDVKVIYNDENVGFSGANNVGFQYAIENHYNYVMLLNNDTIVEPDMIEILSQGCDEHTVILPRMMYYDHRDLVWYDGGRISRFTGKVSHPGQGKPWRQGKPGKRETGFATGCCILMKSSIIEKVGYLRDDYFLYSEDVDYSLRLQEAGIDLRVDDSAVLYHKEGRSTLGNHAVSVYYLTRNRLKVIADHPDFFFFSAHWISILVTMMKIIYYRFRGNDIWKTYRKAIADQRNGFSGKAESYI